MKILSDFLQVVQERAEGPKALRPGHRPGYTSNQQCALLGQKLYITSISEHIEVAFKVTICNLKRYDFNCFIYFPFPLSPPIPFRDDKLPSHPHR